MRFHVAWTPTAEQELAAVWMDSGDRSAVTSAATRIDRLLANDAEGCGEVYFDTVRTLLVSPLGVHYEVVEEDQLVFVLAIWDTTQGTIA